MSPSEEAAEPEAELWEPMESAPLDGTPIRVKKGELQAIVSWSAEMHNWVLGLSTEPGLLERILPWHPTSWAPVPNALE
jgi:hypothetical protein